MSALAFGSWRCNCTMLAKTLEDVPERCPQHGEGLLDKPSWTLNPYNVPLGYEPHIPYPRHVCDEWCQTCEERPGL